MIYATSHLCPKCRSRCKDLVERGGEWVRMGKSSELEILRFQRAFQILKFKRENVEVVNEERNEYQVTFSLSVYIFV